MKAGAILKIQRLIVKNAPTILAVLGGIGTIASVCLSSDAALKAKEAIEQAEREAKGDDYELYSECKELAKKGYKETAIIKQLDIPEDEIDVVKSPLSNADKAWIYIKSYAPTAFMTTASLICIFGSNHINKKRIASLAGAYLMSETALKEYKEKAKEVVGAKKAQQISDEIVQDHMDKNPASTAEIANTPASQSNIPSLSLWYDIYSDRYFYANAEMIRKAEIEVQKILDKNLFASVNDVYAILGVKEIPLGEYTGWTKKAFDDDVQVHLAIGGNLNDSEVPIGTMDMNINTRPSDQWCGEI